MMLLLATLALADCPSGERTRASALASSLSRAETAFAEMDEAGFLRARAEVRAVFECLGERLEPHQVVSLHVHEALAAFLDGNETATVESLQAATRVYGGDALPSRVAPAGTALRTLYDDAWHDTPRESQPFVAAKRTVVYVDGKKSTSRPVRTATLVQVESGGSLVDTAYLRPGEALPASVGEGSVVATQERTGVHVGVEAGLPLGGRVEFALANNYVECVAIRVGGNVNTAGPGLVVAAAVDVPMGESTWDIEATAGVFIGAAGPYLVGAAAQYDPDGAFQLNLGVLISGVSTFSHPMADINAQWVW